MPNVHGVVNHLKYIRSNWTVVIGGFVLILASILVGSSLMRAGENANATTYNNPYNSSGSNSYNNPYSTSNSSSYNNPYNSSYSSGTKYNNPYSSGSSGTSSRSYNNPYSTTSTSYNNPYNSSRSNSYNNPYSTSNSSSYNNPYSSSYSSAYKYYYNGKYWTNPCSTSSCGDYTNYYTANYKYYYGGWYYKSPRSTYSPHPTYSPTPTPQPQYSCNSLSIVKVDHNKYRFTTTATASHGAIVTGYRYEFGDGIVQDGSSMIDHTYNRSGTFATRAWVRLSVNGHERWATSEVCTKVIGVAIHTNPCNYHCTTSPTPAPMYSPSPAQSVIPSTVATSNTNNNNSSATATANVVINQTPAEVKSATIQNASTATIPSVAVAPASAVVPAAVSELPKTGPEDIVVGGLGLGSMLAAGSAYINSRRSLLGAAFKK